VLHKFLVVIVKKLLKSVHIYRSYRQNNPGGPFFWNTRYNRDRPNLNAQKYNILSHYDHYKQHYSDNKRQYCCEMQSDLSRRLVQIKGICRSIAYTNEVTVLCRGSFGVISTI